MNKQLKNTILILFAVIFSSLCRAQDFQYSLFNMAPLVINPALTGNYDGDLRVINNYRTQWSAVAKPFITYSLSADKPFLSSDEKASANDFFAAGLLFNADKAGSSQLKNTSFMASGSYNKSLDGARNSIFSFGLMMGLQQRSLSLAKLSWDSQYNGFTYDPSLPSNESSVSGDAHYHFDMTGGLAFTSRLTEQVRMNGGIALHHLTRPKINLTPETDRLYRKLAIHASSQISLNENQNSWILPRVLFVQQGPSRLLNLGLGVKFRLNERSRYTNFKEEKNISFGMMYRLQDAVSGWLRIDYGSFAGAICYDINVSLLKPASQGKGAMELMLMYTGIYSSANTRMANRRFL